jgi:hypothetical protein
MGNRWGFTAQVVFVDTVTVSKGMTQMTCVVLKAWRGWRDDDVFVKSTEVYRGDIFKQLVIIF